MTCKNAIVNLSAQTNGMGIGHHPKPSKLCIYLLSTILSEIDQFSHDKNGCASKTMFFT